MPILFFDTETTDKENQRLVQIAYKKPGVPGVSHYFRPPVKIEFGAMAIHHITNEFVAGAPTLDESGKKERLQELFSTHTVVAHNAPFDIQTMKNEGITISTWIDTLKVAQHLIESDAYNLQYLRYSLGLKFVEDINPHDALSDVIVLEGLYNHLHKLAQRYEPFNAEGYMVKLSQTPLLMKTMPFGKHKGIPMTQVPRDYLDWLNRQPELSEDMQFTLNHYLK